MTSTRASGLLLHPTSLPGRFGIGDLGPEASRWVDFLAAAGQRLWQVLPLGPTGYGDSPYQSFSAFAGNPYLVSPERLSEDGLLGPSDLAGVPAFPADRVDYGPVIEWKLAILAKAHARFSAGAVPVLRAEYDGFCHAQADWLEDFALFMALKEAHGGATWTSWEKGLVAREPGALAAARERLASAVDSQRFRQFLFFRQWRALRARARAAGRAHHRRPAHLRRARQRRRLGPSGTVPARRPGRARRSWPACRRTTSRRPGSSGATRSTAGTTLRAGRLRLVGGAAARHLRGRGRRAARPLPRLRGMLGGAGGACHGRERAAG